MSKEMRMNVDLLQQLIIIIIIKQKFIYAS